MARRDSNDPLNPRSTNSPTTTLENETTGTSGATGATGAGNLGSSGLSGTSAGVGTSGTVGTYGYGTSGTAGTGSLGTTGTGSLGTAGTGAPQTNWQRAGQEGQGNYQGGNLGNNLGNTGAAAQVKEEARGLASEAKNQALGMASQAKGHVQNLVGERKDRAAEQIGNFAGSLREAARKLEEGDGGATALGRYATTAAEQVDRVSQYLRDRDLDSFVRDAETFARRHPDVFLGGTFIAGLILARFFKASERRHQDEYNESWQTVGYAGSTGAQSAYGQTYDRSYGPSGPSYGNTYNSPASAGTRSSYDDERSESAFSPSGPVPPVGG